MSDPIVEWRMVEIGKFEIVRNADAVALVNG
jgi:hypothetical protein